MEETIFDILNESFKRNLIYSRPITIREASEKAVTHFKEFLRWKDDLKCPFQARYNGIDKTKPKLNYKKGDNDREYTIDEVYEFWENLNR